MDQIKDYYRNKRRETLKGQLAQETAGLIIKHLEDSEILDWTTEYENLRKEIKDIIVGAL